MMEQLALEGHLLNMADRFRDERGEEALEEAIVELILPFENELRANEPPDHPALVLLDEWRAERSWRGKGKSAQAKRKRPQAMDKRPLPKRKRGKATGKRGKVKGKRRRPS